jgi:hypothetical protein
MAEKEKRGKREGLRIYEGRRERRGATRDHLLHLGLPTACYEGGVGFPGIYSGPLPKTQINTVSTLESRLIVLDYKEC